MDPPMSSPWLLLGVAAPALTAFACFDLGRLLARRRAAGDQRGASAAYAWCWRSLGVASLAWALASALALAGAASPVALLALSHLHVAGAAGAFGALLAHVLHIVRGRRSGAVGILAGAIHFAAGSVVLVRADAEGLVLGPVRASLDLGVGAPVAAAIVYGPFVAGALAYAALLFTVRSPETRYRVVLTSASLLLWATTTAFLLVASALGDVALEAYLVVESAVPAVALALAARPPAWARAKWGLRPAGS